MLRRGAIVAVVILASVGATVAGPCLPGKAIVKLRQPLSVCAANLEQLNFRWQVSNYELLVPPQHPRAHEFGLDRLYLVSFDIDVDPADFCQDFSASPLVEYAGPDALLPLDSLPSDSLYHRQWHLEHIGAPLAWEQAHGDSAVLLSTIADGVHWTHPDIETNLWVNAPEDVNHNGRFDTTAAPAGDVDGIDQDGNGYVDDVIGWDFVDRDCNPMASDANAASTHDAGVMNAVTDNDIGVAAPPWNVRTVAVRTGRGGSVYLDRAVSSIYYFLTRGVWAFTMHFGTTSQYAPLRDACAAAWSSGEIPCAGVGNDYIQEPRYPACYDGVIAVAAHGHDNLKSGFSNYGSWVDITAPGEDILSTQGDTWYEMWDGTGPASALVVGVLGWIKSAYPTISRDSALQILYGMCDTMPDPLYQQGLLGHGRLRMSTAATGLAGQGSPITRQSLGPTIARSVLRLAEGTGQLIDATGCRVLDLSPGSNDVSALSPGIYFVRSRETTTAHKVVISR